MKWVRNRLRERSTWAHLFNCGVGLIGVLVFGPSAIVVAGLVLIALVGAAMPDRKPDAE